MVVHCGAMFISNNFLITRTVISNNSARYGGALNYDSYFYYGHVQNNLNIFNSTISDNMALISGGAMRVGQANITVHQSNIYDNFAPESSTISSAYITSDSTRVSADMRYNYWGPTQLNGRPANADNSVYNFPNIRIGSRLSNIVTWIIPNEPAEDDTPVTPVDPGNNDNNPGTVNPTGTNSHSATNTNIGGGNGNSRGGYSGNVIGPSGNPNGQGSNLGDGDGGQYTGPGSSSPAGSTIGGISPRGINVPTPNSIPSTNTGNPEFIYQDIPSYTPPSENPSNPNSNGGGNSNMNGQDGTARGNSVSRTNSSQFDASLDTFGLVANAISASVASPSNSGESSEGESSQSSSSSSDAKSYEIDEESVEKKIDNDKPVLMSLILVIVVIFLLIFGYRRKSNFNNFYIVL